jgi:hypothetical protein
MSTLVSEKAAEILFNRFMLQWFGLGGAQLFAPTSRQEYDHGYDGKVVGFGAMRELYLQFKSPSLSERDRRFTVTLDPRQHSRLRTYPAGSAYYVAGMFSSMADFNRAQTEVRTAEDFLRHFLCVDASALPDNARRVTYGIPESHSHSPRPGYKTGENGRSPLDYVSLDRDTWDRGNTLVDRLRKGQVGRVIRFDPAAEASPVDQALSGARTAAAMTDADCKALGTFVRVPL